MSSPSKLVSEQFLRANAYNPDWVVASASGGANALWLADWLTSVLDLKPGMRVLDLGCGRAVSSIFLAREFGVNVCATDLWFSPAENAQRIQDAGFSDKIYPIHADARQLPFATEFFDAIVSIDAFPYFGTDDHYLNYLTRFVKPQGVIAIACAGFVAEIEGEVPVHLKELLEAEPAMWSMHSPAWWRRHWERTGVVDVDRAESMPEGWRRWLEWHRTIAPDNHLEIDSVAADQGRHLGYYRVVARRRPDARLHDAIVSIPADYVPKPLLRDT
jgi:ubiquinone/menaquinone biosynthesis C-methylase UbiE